FIIPLPVMNEKTIQAEWQLLNKGLYVSFLRMSPGKEQAFLDEISERKGYKKGPILYYKCLGYYDLVELHEISDLNDAFIYKTHRDLLEIVSIPCFSWSEEKYSKAIFSWVGDKPLLF